MVENIFDTGLPRLVLFDMDHTLIDNDCDVSWKEFMVEKGLAPSSALEEAAYYYESYCRGELDIEAFLAFQFAEIAGKSKSEIVDLSNEHFQEKVIHRVYPFWIDLIKELHERSIKTGIVSATNQAVASPIARYLGIQSLITTELECINGTYSGKKKGAYCYSDGKIEKVLPYISQLDISLNETAYFGDSLSDYPLMKLVKYPIMVNPKEKLLDAGGTGNWKQLSLTLK